MLIIYEDNHIIIVSKRSGEIVQGDKTGDEPLSEKVKQYLKEKHQKPGNVFLGVVHRLDRPVWGLVVFAKTSKALTRLNQMFKDGEVKKTYWAITKNTPPASSGVLIDWLLRNEKQNKSYAYNHEVPNAKKAILKYRVIGHSDHYNLIEVNLMTGRHHQIRCQLANMGCPIKGDLKYGAQRSNPDGSISLLAHKIEFIHPVSNEKIEAVSPLPDDHLWNSFNTEKTFMKKITIAIDGFSSSGKSTMAKNLARSIGYIYVDTGAMYRAVTLYAIENQLFNADGSVKMDELSNDMKDIHIMFKLNKETGKPDTYLNGRFVEQEIRSLEVSQQVSEISAISFVRKALVAQQQLMGQSKGIVMDGRDIGTVVFPDAELKIFVTASPEVRAQRRFEELKQKGMPADYDEILKNVTDRDYQDSHRDISPLRQADDALVLDNSFMSIDEQQKWLIEKVEKAVRQ